MKTAEQWWIEGRSKARSETETINLLKQIQLDAVREAIPLIEKIGTTGVERTDIILKAEKWLARIRELESALENK